MIVSVRAAVAHSILEATATQKPSRVLEPLLRLSKLIVERIDDRKLTQKHSEVLQPALAATLKHPDPTIASSAQSILSALRARRSLGRGALDPSLDTHAFLTTLTSPLSTSQAQVEAWTCATQAVQLQASFSAVTKRALLELFPGRVQASGSDEAAIFIEAAVREWSLPDDLLERVSSTQVHLRDSPSVLQRMAALSIALKLWTALERSREQVMRTLDTLCSDSSHEVSSAAFHGIGRRVEEMASVTPVDLSVTSDAISLLDNHVERLADVDSQTLVQASWTIASIADTACKHQLKLDRKRWLASLGPFLDRQDRVSTNSIRATGALLERAEATDLDQRVCLRFLRAVSAAFRGDTPKSIWNAAHAFERSVTNTAFTSLEHLRKSLLDAVQALQPLVASSHTKVAQASTRALSAAARAGIHTQEDGPQQQSK